MSYATKPRADTINTIFFYEGGVEGFVDESSTKPSYHYLAAAAFFSLSFIITASATLVGQGE